MLSEGYHQPKRWPPVSPLHSFSTPSNRKFQSASDLHRIFWLFEFSNSLNELNKMTKSGSQESRCQQSQSIILSSLSLSQLLMCCVTALRVLLNTHLKHVHHANAAVWQPLQGLVRDSETLQPAWVQTVWFTEQRGRRGRRGNGGSGMKIKLKRFRKTWKKQPDKKRNTLGWSWRVYR